MVGHQNLDWAAENRPLKSSTAILAAIALPAPVTSA
jgi:hypothetical protein